MFKITEYDEASKAKLNRELARLEKLLQDVQELQRQLRRITKQVFPQ